MKKTYLLSILVVLLILGGGAYYYYQYGSNSVEIAVDDSQITFQQDLIQWQRPVTLTAEQKKIFADRIDAAQQKIVKGEDLYGAYLASAVNKLGLGDLSGALADYQKAAAINPKTYIIWNNIGNVYRDAHDYSNAEQSYLKGIEVAPDFPENYLSLLDLYRYQSNLDNKQLERKYLEYMDKNDTMELKATYSKFLEDNKRYDEAILMWENYLKIKKA